MTIQIEIGTTEQYEKIARFLTRLKVRFSQKNEPLVANPTFNMEAYRHQIIKVSVWTDADIHTLEQSTQNIKRQPFQ